MSQVRESALALALTAVPDSPEVCLAQLEELAFARDRLEAAIAGRAQRVHAAGTARQAGHASTRTWLRSVCGMSRRTAYRTVALGIELARLPEVGARFAAGNLTEAVVAAICAATTGLSDEDAAKAETILLELADSAGPEEIAKAGRYLRAVLDPDGELNDADADYDARFLLLRETDTGGVEGEFHLPREAAARLRAVLDAYAKPKAHGDDRPQRVRNADALIALLEQQITTELLVLINAESLPDDATHHSAPPGDSAPDDTTPDDTAPAGAARNDGPERGSGTGAGLGARGDASADLGPAPVPEPAPEPAPESGHGDGADPDDVPAPGETTLDDTTPGDTRPGDAARNDRQSLPRETDADPGAPGNASGDGPSEGDPSRGVPSRGDLSGNPGQDDPAESHRPGRTDRPADHGRRDRKDRDRADRNREGRDHERLAFGGMDFGGMDPTGRMDFGDTGLGDRDWRWQTALRTLPGLLLSTGHLLPITDIHRLACTSTLVRLVMNAEGQVLDMGRKTRLATPAQRRAIAARYDTCMVDGCPLPASMCQVDHLDNWSDGGRTDLAKLGPMCQYHNRDRYRNPGHYRRRQTGPDRWAFTYTGPSPTRKR